MKLKDGFFLMPDDDDLKANHSFLSTSSRVQKLYFEIDERDWNFLCDTAKEFKTKKWKNYDLSDSSLADKKPDGMNPAVLWFYHQITFLTHRMRNDKKIQVENRLYNYVTGYADAFSKMLELKSILDSSPEIKSKVLKDWKQDQILYLAWETRNSKELLDCLENPENLLKAPQQNRA